MGREGHSTKVSKIYKMLDGDHCYAEKVYYEWKSGNADVEESLYRPGYYAGSHQKGLKGVRRKRQSIWHKNVTIRKKIILIFQ